MHRISYSGRHPPMCKYLDWSSLHGMQRLSSVSTCLPGHHLTQKLNWDWRSYQEAQQPQSPPMATYFCPWVSSLQIFMNRIPLEKQPGQLSLAFWLTAQPAPCDENIGQIQEHQRRCAVPAIAVMLAQNAPESTV